MISIVLQPKETIDAAAQLAARITSGTMSLDELAQIAETSLAAQNSLARVRVYAERQIAQQYLLFDGDEYVRSDAVMRLSERGWSKQRIEQAQRFAQLNLLEIDDACAAHTAGGRETTALSMKQLLPVQVRETPAHSAEIYTSPPVDIAISRAFGVDEDDHRAQQLATSISNALSGMENPRHARIWATYHGVKDDGTLGESFTFAGIAQLMGREAGKSITREYVESCYYRAAAHVYLTMLRDQLRR